MENEKKLKFNPDDMIAAADEQFLEWMKNGRYAELIDTMPNLGRYSLRNQMLILMQNPKATCVNGMNAWNYKRRHIEKGQREFIPLSQNKLDTLLENMQKERLNGHYYPWNERKLNLEYGNTPTYSIYQLKESADEGLFLSYRSAKKQGLKIDKSNYELVYISGNYSNYSLDELYETFNIRHPLDFRGHSLSVSDVIVFKDKDGTEAYFVDSCGFIELTDFFGPAQKKPAQM